jgi:hypothetical protein
MCSYTHSGISPQLPTCIREFYIVFFIHNRIVHHFQTWIENFSIVFLHMQLKSVALSSMDTLVKRRSHEKLKEKRKNCLFAKYCPLKKNSFLMVTFFEGEGIYSVQFAI